VHEISPAVRMDVADFSWKNACVLGTYRLVFGKDSYLFMPDRDQVTFAVCLGKIESEFNETYRIEALPYLTLPSGWAGCYTCPALRPYQFGPVRSPDVARRSQ